MTLRALLPALLPLAALMAAMQAMALGFGSVQAQVTMGYPLDFVIPVRVEPGETVSAECVSAEVVVGDVVLPRHAVSATIEGTPAAPTLRVRTQSGIEEPVLGVTVTVGCENRVSRRFTLLADPPGGMPSAPLVAAAATPAAAPAVTAPAAPPSAAPPPPAKTSAAPAFAGRDAQGAATTAPAMRSGSKSVARPSAKRAPAERAQALKPSARPSPAAAAAEPSRPRLQLDSPSVASPGATAAAAAAASAALEREATLRLAEQMAAAAQGAASAAEARVSAMERELQALRKESQANREVLSQLHRSLEAAEDRGRWAPLLLSVLLGLAAMVIWLAWKLKQARQAQAAPAWWVEQQAGAATAGGEPAAVTEHASTAPVPTAPVAIERTITIAPAGPLPAPAAMPLREEVTIAIGPRSAAPPTAGQLDAAASDSGSAMQRTLPMPPGGTLSGMPSRDVSIEELLDLEQQAEFFIVLGQDEAAIDLLVGHLRSTGGTVPLPYLKLMEVYRRLGDEPAYERMRDRFNQRFNAVAPGWGTDLNAGRSLEDYTDVMMQIERVWPEPVDAMAVLETLLFRTDASELFDLPAYREVLFLYSLARDLLDRSANKGAHVDVLLPLADGSEYAITAARPYLSDDFGDSTVDIMVESQPTAPVDLDLAFDPEPVVKRPASQFGFFEPGSEDGDKPRG